MDALDAYYASDSDTSRSDVEPEPQQQMTTTTTTTNRMMIQWDKDYITPKLQQQQQDTFHQTAIDFDHVQSLERQHAFHNPHFITKAYQRIFGGSNCNHTKHPNDPTLFSIQTILAKEKHARISGMQPPPSSSSSSLEPPEKL
jgi:hypothetical protein